MARAQRGRLATSACRVWAAAAADLRIPAREAQAETAVPPEAAAGAEAEEPLPEEPVAWAESEKLGFSTRE